jgi:hypothetical protein
MAGFTFSLRRKGFLQECLFAQETSRTDLTLHIQSAFMCYSRNAREKKTLHLTAFPLCYQSGR